MWYLLTLFVVVDSAFFMSVITKEQASSLRDIVALTKPKITLMTIVVALGGMLLAHREAAYANIVLGLVGIAFLVSGSSAFNMYWERNYDALMLRTKDRPLPSGRLQPGWALLLGWILSLAALPALYFGTNNLTAILGIFSLVAYVLLYTPMKRISSSALVIGAVPGAMPVLMGYTAVSGKLDVSGLTLFGLAFFWQLPHVIAISIFRKDEYTKAGYPVVAEITGIFIAKILIFLTTILVAFSSLSIYLVGLGGKIYLVLSLFLGAWFLIESIIGFFTDQLEAWAKRVFYISLIYQLVIFFGLIVDVLVKHLLIS